MQDRHERDGTESVMLGPAFQTSWVMEKLHVMVDLFLLVNATLDSHPQGVGVPSSNVYWLRTDPFI